MDQVQCLKIRLHPGQTERFVAFALELKNRSDEVQFAGSSLPIDQEAMRVITATWASAQPLEVLVDLECVDPLRT